MRIDLDAAKAARREASKEGPVVVFGGKEFMLQPEIPFEATEHLAAGKVTDAVKSLLGEHHKDFMAAGPSVEDLMALFEQLTKAYGFEDVGESPASVASS